MFLSWLIADFAREDEEEDRVREQEKKMRRCKNLQCITALGINGRSNRMTIVRFGNMKKVYIDPLDNKVMSHDGEFID